MAFDRRNISIINGNIHGYFYGIKLQKCVGVKIHNMNASANWLDPWGLQSTPPTLVRPPPFPTHTTASSPPSHVV